MTEKPTRFPKVKAPLIRTQDDRGNYTLDSNVNDGYSWVFDRASDVEAVEKLHGTNAAVLVEEGEIVNAVRRRNDRFMAEVDAYSTSDQYIVRGIQNSRQRFSYMEKDFNGDGWYFGEVVGPRVQGNPYDLDEHLFVPFDWLRRKAEYKSYGKYSVEFEDISYWFENELFSLFYSLMHGVDNLQEASVSNGVFVEGIVFVHPEYEGYIRPSDMEIEEHDEYGSVTHSIAKLRRDMFSWYY